MRDLPSGNLMSRSGRIHEAGCTCDAGDPCTCTAPFPLAPPEIVEPVVMHECNGGGDTIPGTARLALPWLDQSAWWVTQDGRWLRLDEMTASHRRNLLRWLERRAFGLMMRHDIALATGPLAPRGDAACDAFEQMLHEEQQRDDLTRLRETKLYRRLAYLVAQDPSPEPDVRPYSGPVPF